jgi:hypothetical protein
MTRRMSLMLLSVGVLGTLFVLDRFVLNRSPQNIIAEPVARQKTQKSEIAKNKLTPSDTSFLGPLSGYDELWKRPVFDPSRKPTGTVSGPREVNNTRFSSDQPPDFNIVGVALGPANSAVLVREGHRTIKRYYVNEQIDGWTIELIDAESITVTRGEDRWQLPIGSNN